MTPKLGKPAAVAATQRLAALFPRWKHTPELLALWVTALGNARIDPEQATALIDKHRRERRGDDPSLADFEKSVRACQPVTVAGPSPRQGTPYDGEPRYTLGQLGAAYLTGGRIMSVETRKAVDASAEWKARLTSAGRRYMAAKAGEVA